VSVESDDGKDLESQLSEIYSAISVYEKNIAVPLFQWPSVKHPQSRKILICCVLFPFLLFLSFLVVVYFADWSSDYIKFAFLLLLLCWYIALPAVQLMEIYADRTELIQFFSNSNQVVVDGLCESISADTTLVKALKKHSLESLHLAKNRISAQQAAIETRVGNLAGALDKVGIVPGLITLIIAAVSEQNKIITLSVTIVIFAVYVSAFTIHYSLPRLSFYVKLLESEISRVDR
jgi:predicted nucleic acid-binding protein